MSNSLSSPITHSPKEGLLDIKQVLGPPDYSNILYISEWVLIICLIFLGIYSGYRFLSTKRKKHILNKEKKDPLLTLSKNIEIFTSKCTKETALKTSSALKCAIARSLPSYTIAESLTAKDIKMQGRRISPVGDDKEIIEASIEGLEYLEKCIYSPTQTLSAHEHQVTTKALAFVVDALEKKKERTMAKRKSS